MKKRFIFLTLAAVLTVTGILTINNNQVAHADVPTVLLSQVAGSTLPSDFIVRDDTAGIGNSSSDYAKFYDITSGTVFLNKDTTAPYEGTYTSLAPGAHQIQIRHVVNGGSEVRVSASFTVSGTVAGSGSCIPQATAMTTGGGRQVAVSTSADLTAALADARAGDTITLADGTYAGSSIHLGSYYATFGLARSGTATAPITIQGSANAIIDGNGTSGRYAFEMYGASYAVIRGITFNNASKGLVLDGSSNNTIDGVTISNTGAEGIHFRAMSANNTLENSTISDTGVQQPQFGEGIYIGSAGDNNWTVYACDQPDTSDHNSILYNTVLRARAESIDIKEGTTGALIDHNTFIGDESATPPAPSGENSADSWMDVKGNDDVITNNTGTNSLNQGFEVHAPVPAWYKNHPAAPVVAWGSRNTFANNTANVNNSLATGNTQYYTGGYGFNIVGGTGNVVNCNNTVSGAVLGFSNVSCTP